MAFTQQQLDALEKAIALGVLTVKYQDKQVTYRSLAEMLQIRNAMKASISSGSGSGHISIQPQFSKGL